MHSSVSQESIYADSDDDRDEERVNDGSDISDGSESSLMSGGERRSSLPSSYNTTWPQSYRQSIDIYSSVASPSIGFLGPSSLSKLGSSFISTSFQLAGKQPPDFVASLIQPLHPPTSKEDDDDQLSQRRSSHSFFGSGLIVKDSQAKLFKDSHGMPRQCSFAQAVLNGINVLCGVGILSAPYAVKIGGWLGLSILLLFAALSWYTGILLRDCLDSATGLHTYPDIGQAAFGTTGRFIISIVLYVELYASCVEYVILESDNLSSLFPNAHLSIGGLYINSHTLFAVLTILIVMPTTWLRDLSFLSYLSAGGVLASILVVLSMFWVGLIDRVGFKGTGENTLHISGIPIAIGLYGYCYSGHAVFPNIYSSLKKPEQYPSVLFTSFAICTVLFAGVAVIGYLMFGDATMSQFTLNLPQELVASRVGIWTTVVNPLTKYPPNFTMKNINSSEII